MTKKDKELFEKFKKKELDLSRQKSFSKELWKKIVLMDATALAKVDQSILTEDMLKEAVKSNPASIKYIKTTDKDLLNEIVEINPNCVRFLDDFTFREEFAEKILEEDILYLAYCPEKFWTIDNFAKLISEKSMSAKEKNILMRKDLDFKNELISKCPKAINYLKGDLDLLEGIIKSIGNMIKDGEGSKAYVEFINLQNDVKKLSKEKVSSLFKDNVFLFPYLPTAEQTEENVLKCIELDYYPANAVQTPEICYQVLRKSLITPSLVDEDFDWIVKASKDERFANVKDDYLNLEKRLERARKKLTKITEEYFESDFDTAIEKELDTVECLRTELENKLFENIKIAEEIFGEDNVWYIKKETVI